MDNQKRINREIEKNAKRRKVKDAVDELKKLMHHMDSRLVKPSEYKMVEVTMNTLTSNDLMCCKKEMLDEIIIPISKAVETYDLPKGLNDICEFIGDKIKMYSETRSKQSQSGKKSGEMIKKKSERLKESREEIGKQIEEMGSDDFNEIVNTVVLPMLKNKFPNISINVPNDIDALYGVDKLDVLVDTKSGAYNIYIKRLPENMNTLTIKQVIDDHKDEDTPLGRLCVKILEELVSGKFPHNSSIHYQFKYIEDVLAVDPNAPNVYKEFAAKCEYKGY